MFFEAFILSLAPKASNKLTLAILETLGEAVLGEAVG